ncbi:hypothetical protein Btru_056886 [Bulinus truncatus]|nr:hypothetical protein Btru_056886 [Bulinus truncatus]
MFIFVVGTRSFRVSTSVQTEHVTPVDEWEPADIEKVHDAYIIAVEDEAKRKLDQFTSDQHVQAVDMTAATDSISSERSSITDSPRQKGRRNLQEQRIEGKVTCEVETTNPLQVATTLATTTASMPGEKKKKNGHDHSSPNREPIISNGGDHGEWLEMNGFQEQEINSKGKGKLRSKSTNRDSHVPIISDYLGNGSISMSEDFDSQHGGYNNGGHIQLGYDSRDTSFDYDDPGPHREMAIDVPENFVANIKSPPRYPPSQPGSQVRSANSSPLKTSHKKSKGDDGSDHVYSTSSKQSVKAPAQQYQPTPQELERMHKHQEDLKKRREEELRMRAENEFLRTSLRGSQKLQALENKRHQGPPATGVINTAFDVEDSDDDEDEEESDSKSHSRLVPQERYLKKNIGVEDLFSSYQQIKSRLNSPEDQKYLVHLRSLFQNQQFQKAVSLHSQVKTCFSCFDCLI